MAAGLASGSRRKGSLRFPVQLGVGVAFDVERISVMTLITIVITIIYYIIIV